MNKMAVNNFIVSMRRSVKQARVHIINKLVKQLRKLKERKGSDEEKEKNQLKIKRLLQELSVIKKINKDDVSKYALLCSEDLSKLLSKNSIPLEEKVQVRFAGNKIVASKVKEFRDLYPEWEVKLPVVLTQLGIQYRQKKRQKHTPEKLKVNKKKKSIGTVLHKGVEISQVPSNGDSEGWVNDQNKGESLNEEELDHSQRFRFVLRNPVMKSGDSDASSLEDKVEGNGDCSEPKENVKFKTLDDVRKRTKIRKKSNGVAEIRKIREIDRNRQSSNGEVCETLTVLDNRGCNDSVSEPNSNVLSNHSTPNLGKVRHDDSKRKKALNAEDCNKLKVLRNPVTGCELPEARNSRFENEEKRNCIGRKVDGNVEDVKGRGEKIARMADIRKFSELLKDANEKTNISSLGNQKETKNLGVGQKEENDPFRENSKNSREKSVSEDTEKVRDSFFLIGDDSESDDNNNNNNSKKSKSEGEQQFKKQNSFGKKHILSGGRTRIVNGRAFQERGKLNHFCPKENRSRKEVSGGVSKQDYDGKSVALNRMQERLLAYASSEESKPTVFEKNSLRWKERKFPPSGQQRQLHGQGVVPMNRKQRRLLERMSSGAAAAGEAGGSKEHLHPSWEAKRKQKTQILPFQGKKIKFDD